MRILHLIGPDTSDFSSIKLATDQSNRLDAMVMAVDGSAAAIMAADVGLPILHLRPGQSARRLADAVSVLTPDLIHLHGARICESLVPLRIFSDRPIALQLGAGDLDTDGGPAPQVRGVRLDWRGGHHVTAICPPGAGHRAKLPFGVSEIVEVREADVTAQWCTALYRRLLLADTGTFRTMVLTGMA